MGHGADTTEVVHRSRSTMGLAMVTTVTPGATIIHMVDIIMAVTATRTRVVITVDHMAIMAGHTIIIHTQVITAGLMDGID